MTDRFGSQSGEHPFAVLGDLNDYLEDDDQGSTGIAELVGWDQLENVVERLPEDERRAHFYPKRRAYHQLDYLLLSRARRGDRRPAGDHAHGSAAAAPIATPASASSASAATTQGVGPSPVVVEVWIARLASAASIAGRG